MANQEEETCSTRITVSVTPRCCPVTTGVAGVGNGAVPLDEPRDVELPRARKVRHVTNLTDDTSLDERTVVDSTYGPHHS